MIITVSFWKGKSTMFMLTDTKIIRDDKGLQAVEEMKSSNDAAVEP